MKLTLDWYKYLHRTRKKEINIIFSKCPKKIFKEGLEIGAGDGFQSILLAKYISNLVSTDINQERLTKKDTVSIEYKICDAENIENLFSIKQFDIIFSSNLLEHLQNPNKVLTSIYNLLKDDGVTIHIMPNPFWKICILLLNIPSKFLYILGALTENKEYNKLRNLIKIFKKKSNSLKFMDKKGNNPKINRNKMPFLYRMLIPEPHGVSSNHIKEFYAFSKIHWKKEFKRANFEILRILNGPLFSGYGFGLRKLKKILKFFGLSSEYMYIVKKKGFYSSYEDYF